MSRLFNLFFCLLCWSLSAREQPLVVGIEQWPPFQIIEDNQPPHGLDIELIKAVMAEAGYRIEFQQMPWRRSLLELQQGNLDILMSATKTTQREAYAVFSKVPFRQGYNALFVHVDSPLTGAPLQKLQDILKYDATLGVMRGNVYSNEYARLVKKSDFSRQLLIVSDEETKLDMLEARRIDGMLGGLFSTSFDIKQRGISDEIVLKLTLHGAEEAQAFLMYSRTSLSPDQIKRLDDALQAINQDGRANLILADYQNQLTSTLNRKTQSEMSHNRQ